MKGGGGGWGSVRTKIIMDGHILVNNHQISLLQCMFHSITELPTTILRYVEFLRMHVVHYIILHRGV